MRTRRPTELRAELVDIGTELVLDALATSLGAPAPQVGEPVYAHKLEPSELEIDWNAPAVEIHRLVRVGGAWTTFRGSRLKIWRTALPPSGNGLTVPTGSDPIELVEVQPEGRARMTAAAWAQRGPLAAARPTRHVSKRTSARAVALGVLRRIEHGGRVREPRPAQRARAQRTGRPRSPVRHRARLRDDAHAPRVRLPRRSVPATRRRRRDRDTPATRCVSTALHRRPAACGRQRDRRARAPQGPRLRQRDPAPCRRHAGRVARRRDQAELSGLDPGASRRATSAATTPSAPSRR